MFSEYNDVEMTEDYLKILFLYIPLIIVVSFWNSGLAISMNIVLLIVYSVNFAFTRAYRFIIFIILFVLYTILLALMSIFTDN